MPNKFEPTCTDLMSGSQLRAGRALAGLSQRAFAARIGVTVRSVCSWEAKEGRPRWGWHNDRVVEVLADAGVTVFSRPTLGVRLTH
jgi:DNA-binding transcriptional regulator YiaG